MVVGLFVVAMPAAAPAAAPVAAGVPEAVVMRYDACGNGRGCSFPGPGDACNPFQFYHVYDLAFNKAWNSLTLLYEPGFAPNCRDTLKVYVSPPPCECPGSQQWTLIYQVATRTMASPAGAWYIYQRALNRANPMYPWPATFQCVRSEISVTPCFNDDGLVIAK
jgi:hypothetical protein